MFSPQYKKPDEVVIPVYTVGTVHLTHAKKCPSVIEMHLHPLL